MIEKLNKLTNIKKTLKVFFKKRDEILFAYIFGSLARKNDNKLSDIDIAIFINNEKINDRDFRYGYKAELITDLIKLLGTDKVDLTVLNEASPLLRHRVIYYGELIYSVDKKRRIEFQIDTINRYIDYKMLKKKVS